ncbi:acetyltransferase [Calothrix parasitica NIES-267]|uniref:Acetyltransferase n=1 Tax=Calothrix parasitica NIES-267 TaxID=1973488 RepID=A0A1Z4LHK6_9CYAN|nr:acetyltransferase [Calothrix parasitica NIES-267]
MSLEIIRLEKTQISQAADTLIDAFRIEPENQEQTQEDWLSQLFFQEIVLFGEENYRETWEACLRYFQPLRHVYTTPEMKGVAVWIPPLGYPLDVWRCLQAGYYTGLNYSFPFSLLNKTYYDLNIKQPYWCLSILGVSKDYRRQGIGSALIKPILERASSDDLPCYLFTQTEEGVKFYESNGFEVSKKIEVPVTFDKTITYWIMKKEP